MQENDRRSSAVLVSDHDAQPMAGDVDRPRFEHGLAWRVLDVASTSPSFRSSLDRGQGREVVVRVIYDHNVMEGCTICRTFHELDRVLHVQILAELRPAPAGGIVKRHPEQDFWLQQRWKHHTKTNPAQKAA